MALCIDAKTSFHERHTCSGVAAACSGVVAACMPEPEVADLEDYNTLIAHQNMHMRKMCLLESKLIASSLTS